SSAKRDPHSLHDALPILLSVVIFAVALALLQTSVWLAAVAVTGGFLAPILASSGEGAHVGLFTYYLILNIGIAVIALYRSWRLTSEEHMSELQSRENLVC